MTSLVPSEIGGYAITRALHSNKSYLALAPGGRKVVLKMLQSDCMLRGQLHPSIRDRLGRVRELAHRGVANLHGVERSPSGIYLVWEYIEGTPFDDYAAMIPPDQLPMLAREMILSIEALHALGIVHGAISGGNVLVDAAGAIRLTHVSPLLYHDPAQDAAAAVNLLRKVMNERKMEETMLGRIVAEAHAPAMPLRQLAWRLAVLIDPRQAEFSRVDIQEETDRNIRGRALLGAAAVLAAGLLIAYVVQRFFS